MNQGDSIDATILDLMLRAGSKWVLWLLIGLSVAAIAVMFERLWFFLQERRPNERLQAALDALRTKSAEDAMRMLKGEKSMEVAVVRACIERAGDGPAAVDEHRAAVVEHERQRYEKRLAFLGTLGNNAPFIGLFGTVLGIIRAGGQYHTLACSQAGRLDHDRIIDARQMLQRPAEFGEDGEARRGDMVPRHEVFAERLRRLDLRSSLCRAEDRSTCGSQRIGQPQRQRHFRPDDRHINSLLVRKSNKCGNIFCIDRHIVWSRSCIARRDEQLRQSRRLRHLPRDGVLAPARTNKEDF